MPRWEQALTGRRVPGGAQVPAPDVRHLSVRTGSVLFYKVEVTRGLCW